MKKLLVDPRLAAVLRVALGALFLYAGVVKASGVHALADEIANYRLLPAGAVPLVAVTLPFVEILLGLALLVGLYARAAALLASTLLVVFAVALLQAFARGIDLTCGCFGGEAPADWLTLVRDGVLLAAAGHVVARDRGEFSLVPGPLRARLGDA